MSRESHEIEVAASARRALDVIGELAEAWGADWQPKEGALHLPVVAGLRRGLLIGHLRAQDTGGGCTRLTLVAETTHWRVHHSAAAVLVMGLIGALPVLLWPLGGEWLALAPVGLVLMFLAWFMVISRLRTAGATEFLEAVQERLRGDHE